MSKTKELLPPEEGAIVRYMCKHGYKAGYFVREVKGGEKWVLNVPENLAKTTTINKTSVVAIRPRVSESDIEL